MRKLITRNTDEGIINSNGIIIDGDISLTSSVKLGKNRFLIIRTIIALVASLCTVYMLSPFVNVSIAVLFPVVMTTLGFVLIMYGKGLFKFIGIAYLILQTGYFFIIVSFDELRSGFYAAIANYFDLANLNSSEFVQELKGLKDYEIEFCIESILILTAFFISIFVSTACIVRFDFTILFISTFPFFEIVIYHGWNPPILALIGLFICWLLTASISFINHYTNKAGIKNTFAVHRKKRSFYFTSKGLKERFFSIYLSNIALLCCGVFAFTMLASAVTGFERPKSFKKLRREITTFINDFSLDKIRDMISDSDSLFSIFDVKSVGGTNGGQLGRSDGIKYDGSTALHVKIQKLSPNTLYLRGYTGGKYEDNAWDAVDKDIPKALKDYFNDMGHTIADFNYLMCQAKGLYNFENIISVSVVGASKRFVYAPYMTDFTTDKNSGKEKMDPSGEGYVKQKSKKYQLEFVDLGLMGLDWMEKNGIVRNLYLYNSTNSTVVNELYSEYVYDQYTDVSDSKGLNDAYEEIYKAMCNEKNAIAFKSADLRSYRQYDYFAESDNTMNGFDDSDNTLSLSDLYYMYNFDNSERLLYTAECIKSYLSRFPYDLEPGRTPNGEDFIDYFLRKQKKGYCSYFASAGTMLLRKFGYAARYAEGYIINPSDFIANDEGIYSATVTDRGAHAWCDLFVDGIGWVPVEFTPGYTENINPNEVSITTTTTTTTDPLTTTTPPPQSVPTDTQTSVTTSSVSSNTTSDNSLIADPDGNNSGDSSEGNGIAVAHVDDDEGSGLGKIFLIIILYLIIILAILFAILIRRKSILGKQRSLTTKKDRSAAVKYIYLYYLKYLSLLDIRSTSNITDESEAQKLAELCKQNELFTLTHDIRYVSKLAIEAQMSNNPISQDDYHNALNALKKLRTEIVPGKLGKFKKFSAKWIYGMY